MDVYWIWLSTIKYVGPILQKLLLTHFCSPKAIYDASREELAAVKGLDRRAVSSILDGRSLSDAEEIANNLFKMDIRLLRYHDPIYPEGARGCKESPVLLYYKGHLKQFQTSIGVVGSRRCTSYGRKVAEEIGTELAYLQIPVVSGFAKGIDSYTHAACLQHGGYPIVFLAGGVDVCYPKEQRPLYGEILENQGVFLSQYPPGTPPKPKQFLQRNALISAWSTELIVVEAGKDSGAIWTSKFAKSQGKKVFAVPNQIHVPEGQGTNRLLAEGAEPYLGINSLHSMRNLISNGNPSGMATQENQPILSILSETPHSISALSNRLNINEQKLMDELLNLELDRKIIIRGNMVGKV